MLNIARAEKNWSNRYTSNHDARLDTFPDYHTAHQNLVLKSSMFLWVNLGKTNAAEEKHSRKLQEPTYPFSLNLICQIEVIYVQSVCIVTILSIK